MTLLPKKKQKIYISHAKMTDSILVKRALLKKAGNLKIKTFLFKVRKGERD